MTADPASGAYGPDDDVVDYILGITFEIWEERGIDLIHKYYGADTVVYSLDGIIRGAAQMVDGTVSMLNAFPDRLLLPDDVIWSGDRESGYYSSHRITSPMTNTGDSIYGPATGRPVRILTIADCIVEEGVITGEWLIRDNHALVSQLGFDVLQAAKQSADRRNDESYQWIAAERQRLSDHGVDPGRSPESVAADPEGFARRVLASSLTSNDAAIATAAYAPYAVLHRSAIELYSGRDNLLGHYAGLRNAFAITGMSVDHVAMQPFGHNGQQLAIRWTATGDHVGEYLGVAATQKPIFILAETHWRVIDDRITTEWTIFDNLALLSQLA